MLREVYVDVMMEFTNTMARSKPSYNSKSTVLSDIKNVILMGCKNHINDMYILSITHLQDYTPDWMPIEFLYPTGYNINFPHISNGLPNVGINK